MISKASDSIRQKKLAELLREARVERGMTQQDLAEAIGHTQQFVSKYESGERRLNFFEVLDVASALGIQTSNLLELASGGR